MPIAKYTVLFLCDIQEKYGANIPNIQKVVAGAKLLSLTANHLQIPIIATEQNPQSFGRIYEELAQSDNCRIIEKTKFSMIVDEVTAYLKELKQCQGVSKNVILCGLDAHICVFQTALDLLALGFNVHVCVDAIGSQREQDKQMALMRLERAGVCLTSSESVIFQLLRDAKHEKFKSIQPLIKQYQLDIKAINSGKDPKNNQNVLQELINTDVKADQ